MDPGSDFTHFISTIDAAVPGGTVPILAAVICGLVSMYRSAWLQNILPAKFQWDSWSIARKWAFSMTTGTACGVLTNVAAGKSLLTSTALGLGAGISAMGLRQTVKAVQSTATMPPYNPNLKSLRDPPMT